MLQLVLYMRKKSKPVQENIQQRFFFIGHISNIENQSKC
jgi:hypothetical protein